MHYFVTSPLSKQNHNHMTFQIVLNPQNEKLYLFIIYLFISFSEKEIR